MYADRINGRAAATFIEDFNGRFAKSPRNPHDAHRPVDERALDSVFSWQEERTMSRNLGRWRSRTPGVISSRVSCHPRIFRMP
jgi:hypothetical protein